MSYVIMDAESGDSAYWNGYHLTGGTKQVIELIYDSNDNSTSYALVGAVDSNGFIYSWWGIGMLQITAPDGASFLVEDFQNGDLGIDVGDPVGANDVQFFWVEAQPNVWEWRYQTSLPLSAIALNGNDHDYSSLPGFAATLAADGPNAIPTTWLP